MPTSQKKMVNLFSDGNGRCLSDDDDEDSPNTQFDATADRLTTHY